MRQRRFSVKASLSSKVRHEVSIKIMQKKVCDSSPHGIKRTRDISWIGVGIPAITNSSHMMIFPGLVKLDHSLMKSCKNGKSSLNNEKILMLLNACLLWLFNPEKEK